MGVVLTFRSPAFGSHADSGFCIGIERIAVDCSGRISVGTGLCTVDFAHACFCEMISGDTGCDDARSVLADAGRSEVCRIAVQALRAAVIILIDAGMVVKTRIVGAGADDALPRLTIFIGCAFCIAFAAVERITLELFFGQTHRICVGSAVEHVIIACIDALPLTASSGFGGFPVGTHETAGTAVIGIAAMNIDADVLILSCAK